MSAPPSHRAAVVAASATLRRATLTPDDVLVLAAVEVASDRGPSPTVERVAASGRLHHRLVAVTLEGLRRHRLVESEPDAFGVGWRLTKLGREVLAELIRAERRRVPRSR